MMHHTAVSLSLVGRRITGCVLAGILLIGTGCVSQRAYDQIKAEHDELTRALDAERANMSELDRHIAVLQAANKTEDEAATNYRTAIQHNQQLMRRASEDMTSLQTQVANLVYQGKQLARQVADVKREHHSLTTLVAQYKEEVEEAQSFAESSAPPASASMQPAIPPATAESAVAEPSVSVAPTMAAPNPVSPPQQMAQVTPVTPVKPPASTRPAQSQPEPLEASWIDMVMNWLSSVWSWIFGLFS
jgi:septal ring factor EnvC (AmiA/AmiB activator)